jgi:hypothetical protein
MRSLDDLVIVKTAYKPRAIPIEIDCPLFGGVLFVFHYYTSLTRRF